MRMWRIGLSGLCLAVAVGACGRAGGAGGAAGSAGVESPEPAGVAMETVLLTRASVVTGETRLAIRAPAGVKAELEYNTMFRLVGGDLTQAYFHLLIQEGSRPPLAQRKAELLAMNVERTRLLIDRPELLVYEQVLRGGRIERGMLADVKVGDKIYRCESVGPNDSYFTRGQLDRMVESCSSLQDAS
jgi:hypothetical protein